MPVHETIQLDDSASCSVVVLGQEPRFISAIEDVFHGVERCRVEIIESEEALLNSLTAVHPDVLFLCEGPQLLDLYGLIFRIRQTNSAATLIVLLSSTAARPTNDYLRAGADDCVLEGDMFASHLHLSIKQGLNQLVQRKPFLRPFLSNIRAVSSDPVPIKTLQTGHVLLHYRILADLGQGGMGEVYKAEDLKLERNVAIKVLAKKITKNEDARRRLISEARAASALNHPNIVTIYSIEEWEGVFFICMEYVEGESLGSMLRKGPLPLEQVLKVGLHVSEALAAAHAIGVVHRDIKPGNIMITQRGQVKLLDFGLAKRMDSVEKILPASSSSPWQSPSDLTEDGQVMGTVSYMSPEQSRGESLDGRTDIFSLGCVLYEAATGVLPFDGATTWEVMDRVVNVEPAPPSRHRADIPPGFDTVLSRAMTKERANRYASAAEFAEALRELMGYISQNASLPKQELIAVLYFENLSGSQEEEYFRDGMTEDIILELSKIKDLKVLPRSAVVAYRNKPIPSQEIGRQLRASFLLTGSIRREGIKVRITTQLLDARTGHCVWSERYDRELRDVLMIQEDIARSIAQALRITLSPQEEKEIANKGIGNPDAYDYYLRGRNFVRRATHADLEFAMQMFQCAVALEEFALGYAGLSNVCALFYDWYEPDQQWIEKGLSAANASLALEPNLAEGLAARARIFWAQRKYEDAIRYARMAIEQKSDCEGAYWTLGQALFSIDRWQDVAVLSSAAIAASGDDYNVYVPLINAMGRLKQGDEEKKLRKLQMSVLKEQLHWVPEDVRARILLATNHAFFQERRQAAQELKKAVSLRPQDANLLYNAACTFGVMEMKKEALQHLEKAVANGFWNMEWVSRDPDLACLHGDPNFEKLLSERRKASQ